MANNANPIVFQFQSQSVRTITIEGNPWFVAKDVCDVLSLTNPSMALSNLDDDERAKFNLGRQGDTNIINESGLYSLILTSRKPEAKAFKKWVTSEVLPSIRKTGSYSKPDSRNALQMFLPREEHQGEIDIQFYIAEQLVERVGVKKGMAFAVACGNIQASTGRNMEAFRLLLPPAEKACVLNQTELGKLLGVSSHEIGKRLRKHGLMEVINSERVLTEKGHQFGDMFYYSNAETGHTGCEPRWSESVLELIRESVH